MLTKDHCSYKALCLSAAMILLIFLVFLNAATADNAQQKRYNCQYQ